MYLKQTSNNYVDKNADKLENRVFYFSALPSYQNKKV